jgi:hypothetical protein
MPLRKGSSRQAISENIRELMHTYKREGHIAASRPPDKGKAAKQAAAIAYSMARRSRKEEEEKREH